MKTRILVILALTGLSTLNSQLSASPLGTAFTYQGRLNSGGNPASGSYDFKFTLYDADTGTGTVAGPLTNAAVTVSNGLFTVALDFGNVFNGNARWLEIGVRTNGSAGDFTTLSPRQPLTPSPYALYTPNAGTAGTVTGNISANQLTGTISASNIGAGTLNNTMLANGSITAAKLAAGAVTTPALAEGAVTVDKVFHQAEVVSSITITNPCLEGLNFGYAVAAVGADRVLISDPSALYRYEPLDPDLFVHGVVWLFDLAGNSISTMMNPEGFNSYAFDQFGSAVAAVGPDKVVIGAPDYAGGGGYQIGAAYLFSTNGTKLAYYENPTPAGGDQFGCSVAGVGSDRVLIGACGENTATGAAYLFDLTGSLITTFTNPTATSREWFGTTVAAVGNNRAFIGAYPAGYLFDLAGHLITTFTNPGTVGNGFGSAVAVVGDNRVLIGAHMDSTVATRAGAAYLFSTNGTLLATFTKPNPAQQDYFGCSLAAVGSQWVLIGASGDDTGAANTGAAYLFRTDGTCVGTLTNPTPTASDSFGCSVAAAGGDRVLIGACSDYLGAAYLYTLDQFIPGFVASGVRPGAVDTAGLADGAVTAAKIGGVLHANQIPDLDASKIVSGTLADARLSTNVAFLHRSQTFTGGNSFTNASNNFTGDGSGLTSLNADAIIGGLTTNIAVLVPDGNTNTLCFTNGILRAIQ